MKNLWQEVLQQRLQRFAEIFHLVSQDSPFYIKKYAHLSGYSIGSLEDIRALPLTSRAELLTGDSYLRKGKKPQAYFESSGTTGTPLACYPDLSIDKAIAFGRYLNEWMGLTTAKVDCAAVALAYEMTPIGLRFQQALHSQGILVVPTGVRSTVCSPKRSTEIICRAKPQAIFSRPLELLRYGDILRCEEKIDQIGVQKLFYLGETMSEQKWKRIESVWGNADLCGHYGLTEVDTGLQTCFLKNYHEPLNSLVYFELLDDSSHEVTDCNGCGELVISTLSDAAAPLLRYQTGDLAKRVKCACGSSSPAYQILGRRQDGVNFSGVTIFPFQLENIIYDIPEVGNEYQFIIEGTGNLTIKIEKALHCSIDSSTLIEKVNSLLPEFLKDITSIEVYEWGQIANKLGIAKKKGAQFVDLRDLSGESREEKLKINLIDFVC